MGTLELIWKIGPGHSIWEVNDMSRKKSIYKQFWKVAKCSTSGCWCRMIVLPSYDPHTDKLEDCVIKAGAVKIKLARYIVRLHNMRLSESLQEDK